MPFGLPEIDLRAVILDATEEFRQPIANPDKPEQSDHAGPRDPGIIPVTQLNYIFWAHRAPRGGTIPPDAGSRRHHGGRAAIPADGY